MRDSTSEIMSATGFHHTVTVCKLEILTRTCLGVAPGYLGGVPRARTAMI